MLWPLLNADTRFLTPPDFFEVLLSVCCFWDGRVLEIKKNVKFGKNEEQRGE